MRSVVSYANTVGVQIPSGFLPEEQAEQFRSGGYSRLVLYVGTPDEGDRAFCGGGGGARYRPRILRDGYYLTGRASSTTTKQTTTGDNQVVSAAAVIAIGVVLMLTFRSISIPLILLLTIEGAIWLNLGLPISPATASTTSATRSSARCSWRDRGLRHPVRAELFAKPRRTAGGKPRRRPCPAPPPRSSRPRAYSPSPASRWASSPATASSASSASYSARRGDLGGHGAAVPPVAAHRLRRSYGRRR